MDPSDHDIIAVERLLALWGHLLDKREWDRLDECLTADAVYDGSIFGFEASVGLPAIREALGGGGHALAHHATNIIITHAADGAMHVVSKGIGVLDGGVVSSVTYQDTLRLTEAGWRIAHRVLTAPQPSPAATAGETPAERNKRIVREYMTMVMNEGVPAAAVERYLGSPYIQHNPRAVDGAEGVLGWIEPLVAEHPELTYEIKRMAADGDLVWVHGFMTTSPADRGLATMEIFRVEDGRLVEHWDVVQPVPETSANPNTMF